jgi:predicted short-subunit dehydrogenase-like oxidoreductase (DUF2520 family)
MRAVVYGSGNVAWHLSQALINVGVEIVGVCSRNPDTAKALAERIGTTLVIPGGPFPEKVDIIFLMTPDDQIAPLSSALSPLEIPLIHTSGSVSIDSLNSVRKGVLYPLQSFSKEVQPDMHDVPFFIEASSEELYNTLFRIASRISPRVFKADSHHRKIMHLSAVFACNFVNHLYAISADIMSKEDMNFDHMRPLIMETAHKALRAEPSAMQTGPAIRNDLKVIDSQKKLLESIAPQYIPFYDLFTSSIQNLYSKNDTK